MPSLIRRGNQGQVSLLLIGGLGLAAVTGVLALLAKGWMGGAAGGPSDTIAARIGSFDVIIPVSGELVATEQIEIRNRLDTQAVITYIMPEGAWAKTGDVLLKLNDEELRNKVSDAADAVKLADAESIAAAAELDITQKERESELAKAKLTVRLSELALNAWQQGEDRSKRRQLELAHETAQKNFDRLKDRYQTSDQLYQKKFISLDELKQEEIAMIEARAKLEQADIDLELYDNYQRLQDKAKKESDVEQAQGELERTEQRFDAKVRSAQTDLESKKYQLESKRERLRLLEQQLARCTVTAPSPGLVVYYSSLQSSGWYRNEGQPQVGTQLWPNEPVMVLPDTSRMAASVKVSESLSGQIKPGQRATVTCEAVPDRTFRGEVQKVSVLAESGGWRDPNRRDYSVRIVLDEQEGIAVGPPQTSDGNPAPAAELHAGLKPSMRCKADIYVGRVDQALHVPIQALGQLGPLNFVNVRVGGPRGGSEGSGQYEQRKVTVGRVSELYAEITDGLAAGEVVLLREARPGEVVSKLSLPPAGIGSDQAEEKSAPQAPPAPPSPPVPSAPATPSATTTPSESTQAPTHKDN